MPRYDVQRREVRRRSRSDAEIEYVASVDLGYARDYTALALVQRVELAEHEGTRPEYHVRRLKRFALRTETPEIIEYLRDFVQWRSVRDKITLVVDGSGGGRPIFQEMARAGLRPTALVITAGGAVNGNHVSKQVLVSRLKLCMEQRRVKVAPLLQLSAELQKEFQNFQAKLSPSGNWKFGAAAGQHDDLVMAIAMGVHFFEARARVPQVRLTVMSTPEGTGHGSAAWDPSIYREFGL
jgi:hypothetical protein